MVKLFMEGGSIWMAILTIELICAFFAAWKYPAWVKEIGILSLCTGILATLIGCYQMADIIRQIGDIAPGIIWGGLRVAVISTIYGVLIFMTTLVIRIVQKPKM